MCQEHALVLFKSYKDEKKFHLVKPGDSLQVLNPFFEVYATEIKFDPDKDFYNAGAGNYALTGHAHDRIAAAANISFVSQQRVDDRKDPDYAEAVVRGYVLFPDGTYRMIMGSKSFSVTDFIESAVASALKKDPRAKAETVRAEKERERETLRRFKYERALTGAKNRAIRQAIGLRQSYKQEELQLPFVVPVVSYNMKAFMENPQMRAMLGQNALRASAEIFGVASGDGSGHALPPVSNEEQEAPGIQDAAFTEVTIVDGNQAPPPDEKTPNEKPATGEAPDPDEVKIQEWIDAPAKERWSEFRELLSTRRHELSLDAATWADMKNWDDRKVARSIVALSKKEDLGIRGPSEKMLGRFFAIALNKAKLSYDDIEQALVSRFGFPSPKGLSREQYDEICDFLDGSPAEKTTPATAKKEQEDDLPF